MVHELKTDPGAFDDIVAGIKPFELRFNDRNYQVGDTLILRKTKYTGEEMAEGKPLEYISSPLYLNVTYILSGKLYGLKSGWVIMAIHCCDTHG